jgi:DNA-binding NtrC family response regulator
MRPRVLIIDDEQSFSRGLSSLLNKKNLDVVCAASPQKGIEIYRDQKMNFDLALIDYHFEGSDVRGSDLALKIRNLNPDQAIIFMTGFSSIEATDAMLETGAARTFVRKGDDVDRFIEPIMKVVGQVVKFHPGQDTLEDELQRTSVINSLGIVGRSKELFEIVSMIQQIRVFRSRFLIVGDTGTGKEKLAQAFQQKGKAFYAVNCAQFTSSGEQFAESQLFGHIKGAYTGATQDQKGAFELANGGVLFLDEVHHLSLATQAKLLRVLQENKFRRLGDAGGDERKFEATLVAATKPIIYEMMKQGTFLTDLFYRLKTKEIRVPSLRDRPADIRPLAEFFVKKVSGKFGKDTALSPQLIRELEAYSWPGNVRELENFIEASVMTSQSDMIGPEVFRQFLVSTQNPFTRKSDGEIVNLEQVVDSAKTAKIIDALKLSDTIEVAALLMSIKRTTLNDWMKKLSIDPKIYLKKYSKDKGEP